MAEYKYKGRSWEVNNFKYSLRYRLLMKLNYMFYPLLNILLLTDRVYTRYYHLLGVKIGKGSIIRKGTYINDPRSVEIGINCSIHGELKSRGGIIIEDNVELVQDVMVSTQSHNVRSELFESKYSPVSIKSFSWIGPRAIILQGVELSEGTIIGAGSIITKSTSNWGIYAGIPAVKIGKRTPLKLEISDD